MGQSGSKLVIAIGGLALALGAVSWWYRFETAHRATQFWGPEAAGLIEERSEVLGLKIELFPEGDKVTADAEIELEHRNKAIMLQKDLTDARGMVHLRHALLTDSNYLWIKRPDAPPRWRWALKFQQHDRYMFVLLSEDFATLGKSVDSLPIKIISCQPMAAMLKEYFAGLGLREASNERTSR
jgi:hypothetical protein